MEATGNLRLKWFYGILISFIAIGSYFLAKEMFWIALLPVVLGVVFLAMFAMDVLLMVIVFCTPLAINLEGRNFGLALSLPTEPLMAGVMLLFIIKIVFEGGFDKRVLYHPVSVVIMIYLLWMLLTSLTSTMVVVSLKHFVAKLWFICPFYFLGTQLFRDFKNIRKFIWLYIIPLLIVIGYTIVGHQQHGWTQKAAHVVMWPFYNDHTAYAAAIAMFLPLTIGFAFDKDIKQNTRIISGFISLVFITAMILSYTRAAWISLAITLMVFLIFYFRVRFSIVLIALSTALVLFFSFRTQILIKLERNRAQSATDFNKHLQSISNISTDASNLERINRWHSAMRMFDEKPFFGWGPGTYQFKYAPFQQSKEKTIISTNAGDGGNAHSEYIGPLAESGIFGLVTFAMVLIAVIYMSARLYSDSMDREIKLFTLCIFLGLVTYMVHGALNNFLDTDKASVPFWGFIGILVALDVYHARERKFRNRKVEVK
jgi:putative inorganic carbon (HCO3(-)) transporter